ncbi:hypothetical protein Ddye_030645 [Dipteronia dyeriana]|uniref:RNase H type-1 domain-containing protein n=1 Tax=Dipteronia dyeriana TaxID=168575 RepID=A0AAD9WMW7_9ROSI|nr:hypothetical protein Ddye_030645 [Dipteronia dyeriana]
MTSVSHKIQEWVPPKEGQYKANCGVSMDRVERRIGFGIVIRDHNGNVMASCSLSMEASLCLRAANITAVLRSINFCMDCGLTPCSFELDETNIIKWIVNGNFRELDVGPILKDIDSLSSRCCWDMKFNHVDKKNNSVANGLTKLAIESSDDIYWMED